MHLSEGNPKKNLQKKKKKKKRGESVTYTSLQAENIWVMITNNPNQNGTNIQLPPLTVQILHIHTGVNNVNLCFIKSLPRRQTSTQKTMELWTSLFFLFLPSTSILSYHKKFMRWHWPNCNGKSPEHRLNTTTNLFFPSNLLSLESILSRCANQTCHHSKLISVLYWT